MRRKAQDRTSRPWQERHREEGRGGAAGEGCGWDEHPPSIAGASCRSQATAQQRETNFRILNGQRRSERQRSGQQRHERFVR
jgi:hypothetical protein